jgi:soluble P-type ATPase
MEKAAYIYELSANSCVAVGNGNNDANMLKDAALGIALIGDEGCSTKTLMNSDIVCKTVGDALELLLNEKRLIATLRK